MTTPATDITEVVNLLEEAASKTALIASLQAEVNSLTESAQKRCPHSLTFTRAKGIEDDYGKRVSCEYTTTCIVCKKVTNVRN